MADQQKKFRDAMRAAFSQAGPPPGGSGQMDFSAMSDRQ